MTRYRITIQRLDERPEWAAEHKEYLERSRYPQYNNPPAPELYTTSSALTFDADEAVFAAIRKAALEAMP